MQRQSKTYNLRIQVTVEIGSPEEALMEYLNNEEARPFCKSQMLMTALKPFWSSLALLHNKVPLERVIQALQDGKYLWQIHEQYLRERIGDANSGAKQLNLSVKNAAIALTPVTNIPAAKEQVEQNEALPGRRDEEPPVQAEVVEDTNTVEVNKRPFNPFGDTIISRK